MGMNLLQVAKAPIKLMIIQMIAGIALVIMITTMPLTLIMAMVAIILRRIIVIISSMITVTTIMATTKDNEVLHSIFLIELMVTNCSCFCLLV